MDTAKQMKKDIRFVRRNFAFSYLRLAICIICLGALIGAWFLIPKEKYNTEHTALGNSGELHPTKERLFFHMINVGSADALVLQLPNDEIMMIDCGYSTEADEYDWDTIHTYLSEHILEDGDVIDYIFNTHPDADHCNGFVKLLDTYEIKNIYLPFVDSNKTTKDDSSHSPFVQDTATYGHFVDAAYAEQGATVKYIQQNIDPIIEDDITIKFHTPTVALANDPNKLSAIMTLEFDTQVFVFTGDAQGATEEVFIENIPDANNNGVGDMFDGKSVYLKVAHHGAQTEGSNGQAFIDYVKPHFAFISAGPSYDKADGTVGHPAPKTMERLIAACGEDNIFTTRYIGNITAELDGTHISMSGKTLTPTYNGYKVGGGLGAAAILVVVLCFYRYNRESKPKKRSAK